MMQCMAEDLLVLETTPIDREAFAPFGVLIACPGQGESRPVNEGTAERWDDQATCDNHRPEAKLNIATFQARPRSLPFEVVTLEKHPFSTQIFVPLHAARYVVVVAEGKAAPERMHAFVVPGTMGIAYAPDVWHHTLIVLDSPASFACFVWEDGTRDDCHVVELESTARRSLHVG